MAQVKLKVRITFGERHTDALGFKVNNVKVEEDILSGIKEIISTKKVLVRF